jgi:flavin reductase (DIM6/NTAB) family NADH-FMN oxidoreductase RutF
MTVVALAHRQANSEAPPLRQAMRQLANGVSILTTGAAPERTGCTVSSVVSLSMEPPRVLVCINKEASAYGAVQRCRHFAINILGTQHHKLANRFAGQTREKGEGRFTGSCWHPLAAVDCELDEIIERGSHAIAIGHVVAARGSQAGDALVYWRGKYERLCTHLSEPDHVQWAPLL